MTDTTVAPDSLLSEIAAVLNSHSRENQSNTPDFILARVMVDALAAFERASTHRETWFGQALSINPGDAPWVPDSTPVGPPVGPQIVLEWCLYCNARAEFILWGKLFPTKALGPRCYDCAKTYTRLDAGTLSQSAIFDLRRLLRSGS